MGTQVCRDDQVVVANPSGKESEAALDKHAPSLRITIVHGDGGLIKIDAKGASIVRNTDGRFEIKQADGRIIRIPPHTEAVVVSTKARIIDQSQLVVAM
jgi:hypothetical protein